MFKHFCHIVSFTLTVIFSGLHGSVEVMLWFAIFVFPVSVDKSSQFFRLIRRGSRSHVLVRIKYTLGSLCQVCSCP